MVNQVTNNLVCLCLGGRPPFCLFRNSWWRPQFSLQIGIHKLETAWHVVFRPVAPNVLKSLRTKRVADELLGGLAGLPMVLPLAQPIMKMLVMMTMSIHAELRTRSWKKRENPELWAKGLIVGPQSLLGVSQSWCFILKSKMAMEHIPFANDFPSKIDIYIADFPLLSLIASGYVSLFLCL